MALSAQNRRAMALFIVLVFLVFYCALVVWIADALLPVQWVVDLDIIPPFSCA